jgi:hypothetical protein
MSRRTLALAVLAIGSTALAPTLASAAALAERCGAREVGVRPSARWLCALQLQGGDSG